MSNPEIIGLRTVVAIGRLSDRLLLLARNPEKATADLLFQMAALAEASAEGCELVTAAYSATKIVPISVHRNYRPVNPDGGSAA